jgi:hypothetical protein
MELVEETKELLIARFSGCRDQYARAMTWKGKYPMVELITTTYQTAVKLTKEAMDVVEAQLQRLLSLEKWFVDIRYVPC